MRHNSNEILVLYYVLLWTHQFSRRNKSEFYVVIFQLITTAENIIITKNFQVKVGIGYLIITYNIGYTQYTYRILCFTGWNIILL